MATQEKVSQDIISYLKAGAKDKAEALKMLKSAIISSRIALGHELSEDEVIKVVRKEIKSRIEARDLYLRNNRQELADKEEFERELFSSYAPAELSDDDLSQIINKYIDESDNFGQLMSRVMAEVAGRADGGRVSKMIKQKLDEQN